MSNLSLSRFIPDVLKKLLNFGNDTFTVSTILPPELLDRIIDHIYDDKPTLLALGLVSQQTLVRSRAHLFSKLEFSYNENLFDTLVAQQNLARTRYLPTKLKLNESDRQFDAFLTLLEAPWTTFTFALEFLHIKDLFHATRRYKYRPNRNIPHIAARLPNLKSLWLTSIAWPCIPPHIRDFFFQLNITDLQLDCIGFVPTYPNDFIELFSRLQLSVETLTLYNIQLDEIPDLSQQSSIFHRHFCFKSLDSHSLVLLKDVWDPSVAKHLDIAVESFHLRLVSLTRRDRESYTPFISRFLHHFGQSVHRLFINLSEPYPSLGKPVPVSIISIRDTFSLEALPYYESVNLSQCVNLRVVHIETITLDQLSPTLPIMRRLLSVLPSNSAEEIVLTFKLPKGEEVAQLECFFWLELVASMQKTFSMLKRIVIHVGSWQGEDFHPFIEAWRQAGLKELEQEGLVSLDMIPWSTTFGSVSLLLFLARRDAMFNSTVFHSIHGESLQEACTHVKGAASTLV